MTDQPNVGTNAPAGAEGSPSQPVSPPAAQPISGDVMALLNDLGGKFDGLSKELRGLQGRQDKQENNFRAQLARLNQIKEQGGLTDEQALQQLETVDAQEQRWRTLEQKLDSLAGQFGNGGTQPNAQQNMTAVFEQIIGKDNLTNPLVASVISQQYKTAEEAQLAAYKLYHQLSTLPQPNAAQSASMQGNALSGAATNDQKVLHLESLYKNYSANQAEITALENELRQSGVI